MLNENLLVTGSMICQCEAFKTRCFGGESVLCLVFTRRKHLTLNVWIFNSCFTTQLSYFTLLSKIWEIIIIEKMLCVRE